MKEPEAEGLLSSLGPKTILGKVPLLGVILFWVFKMNEIVNKFLLAVDKLMPEMYLKQPGFTYSSSAPFTKKTKNWKFIETGKYRLYLQKWFW